MLPIDALLTQTSCRPLLDRITDPHPGLLELLDAVEELVEVGLYTSATRAFTQLLEEARRHCRDEEYFLFPFATGQRAALVETLRNVHFQLAEVCDKLGAALLKWDGPRCRMLCGRVRHLIEALEATERDWLELASEAPITH